MNYRKIYENLVERSKNRVLEGYTESHHIVPKCMGGSNDKSNLVELTPEEHYIAHQLLVKIYPDAPKLVKAAQMMIVNRPSNKLYGWLRRRFAKVQSESQKGNKNSQYGLRWIYNQELQKSKKIPKNDPLPIGWEEGRKVTNWKISRACKQCGIEFKFKNMEQYCSQDCKDKATSPLYGREQEFLKNYDNLGSMNKALKQMGFPGAISHWHRWGKKVLEMRK